MKNTTQKALTPKQSSELIAGLKKRFDKHQARHKHITWLQVEERLKKYPQKLVALYNIETSGGEPDVVDADAKTGAIIFFDCAAESPVGRRSFCYDENALNERKENKPKNSALSAASEMGIDLLTEAQYRYLQQLGEFDTKTSSWIKTPEPIRKLGGALFCDRRYNTVFVYHNGAQSYYAARGFRGCLIV